MDIEDWLVSQGFKSLGIGGLSKLVPPNGSGDPVELGFMPVEGGEWWGYLMQSNRDDHVTITGRNFYTIEDCKQLMVAIGLPVV